MLSAAIPASGGGGCVMLANTPITTVQQSFGELLWPICEYNVNVINPPTIETTSTSATMIA